MKINLKSIIGAYGQNKEFDYVVDLMNVEIYGENPFKSGARIMGQVVNHLGVLKVIGEIKALYSTSCARCTKPIEREISAEVETILSRDENSVDDDVFIIQDEEIELDDIFVPSLVLNVDMAYLCKEDCKGICQKCGKDLNDGDCDCNKVMVDDRLAILKTLLDKE